MGICDWLGRHAEIRSMSCRYCGAYVPLNWAGDHLLNCRPDIHESIDAEYGAHILIAEKLKNEDHSHLIQLQLEIAE